MRDLARKAAAASVLLGGALFAAFVVSEGRVPVSVERNTVARSSNRESSEERTNEPGKKATSPTLESQPRVRATDPLVDLDVVPHPASEQAMRDARQHELFAALDLALEQLDFVRARALLEDHARVFPDGGWLGQRRGFELVLDCLEHSDERQQLQDRAESYLREERISPLRRSVRRVCIEGRGFRRRS